LHKRDKYMAVTTDSFGDFEAIRTWDQRGWRSPLEVVKVSLVGAADLEYVSETAGRHERGATATLGDEGVGRRSRAVSEEIQCRQVGDKRTHAFDNAVGLIVTCRHLPRGNNASVGKEDDISKRPANVN